MAEGLEAIRPSCPLNTAATDKEHVLGTYTLLPMRVDQYVTCRATRCRMQMPVCRKYACHSNGRREGKIRMQVMVHGPANSRTHTQLMTLLSIVQGSYCGINISSRCYQLFKMKISMAIKLSWSGIGWLESRAMVDQQEIEFDQAMYGICFPK